MHDMYVYCTYGIVLEYDSEKKDSRRSIFKIITSVSGFSWKEE